MISVTISGRVGADAEVRQAGTTDVLSFRVASNDYRHKEKVTDWVSVSMFGQRAAKLAEHVTKGTLVVVRGKGFVREYDGKSGKAYSFEVEASDVELLGSKPDTAQPQPSRYGQPGGGNAAKRSAPGEDYPSDDIPF